MRRRFLNNSNKNIDYSLNYFTIEALEGDFTISLSINDSYYSIDDGDTWEELIAYEEIGPFETEQKILFKIDNPYIEESVGLGTFTISGQCNVSGNIMSLLYGDNFIEQKDLTNKHSAFYDLFYDCSTIIDASNLILPATTLSESCYEEMFAGCTSLITSPQLPSTDLVSSCYQLMFYGCTSLETSPKLPAKYLAERCYYQMFYGTNLLPDCSNIDFTSNSVVLSGGLQGLFSGTKVTYYDLLNILPLDPQSEYYYYYLPVLSLSEYCYSEMFSDCASLTTAPELPATKLAKGCYSGMFRGCTSLTTAPNLYAEDLTGSDFCYSHMFSGCTELTTAPEISAETLSEYCCYYMFSDCTKLTDVPELLATKLEVRCYSYMFSGCTKLTTVPVGALAGEELAEYCYSYMFEECTSLTTAPELKAKELAEGCYHYMFVGCTELTTAPELPATKLARYCYFGMFSGCTSLTTAPELKAAKLVEYCYTYMFTGCSSLNYIKMLATNNTATRCTYYWVYGVANTGDFVKHYKMNSLSRGISGIPNGWNVIDYSSNYFTVEALEDNLTVSLSGNTLYYCIDDSNDWIELEAGNVTDPIDAGQKIQIKLENPSVIDSIGKFTISGQCNVSGNIMSLLYGDNFIEQTELPDWAFFKLFYNCSTIIDASNLILPSDQLSYCCYYSMFGMCTSLIAAPELPAATLAEWCYAEMFSDCASLTTAPELPATKLAEGCYFSMFGMCTSLIAAPELPAATLAEWCYAEMFRACTSLTEAPELPATKLAEGCYEDMFYGCESLTKAPELLAAELVEGCYRGMFSSCSNLNYIKMLATDISASNCLRYWVSYVAKEGTFVKHPDQYALIKDSEHGIPEGWTVETMGKNYKSEYLTIEALEDDLTVMLTYDDTVPGYYRIDGEGDWIEIVSDAEIGPIDIKQKIQIKINNPNLDEDYGLGYFTIPKQCNVSGNIMSLLYGDNFIGQTDLTGYNKAFYELFFECNIKNALNLILPAEILSDYCYCRMFFDCISLTTLPELPSLNLTEGCYSEMFSGCASLNSPPELKARKLSDRCYERMFEYCTSLTIIPELPAIELARYCYSGMFYNCTALIKDYPSLEASILTEGCYSFMFSGCTELIIAPEISAEILSKDCCQYMFYGCKNLEQMPELYAEVFAEGCYSNMFYGCEKLESASGLFGMTSSTVLAKNCFYRMFMACTSLVEAPELPALTLDEECYSCMFVATNLKSAPKLPAEKLAKGCYFSMFSACKNLAQAPDLSAETLAESCYEEMFQYCESLTKAPALTATELAKKCYCKMFRGCTELTTAPELPARILVESCYEEMFTWCGKLDYIRMLGVGITANNCLKSWVRDVAETGAFVKHKDISATLFSRDEHGIPPGWTIIENEYESKYLTIESLEPNNEISFSNDITYSINNNDWGTLTAGSSISINLGDNIRFKGNLVSNNSNGIGSFSTTKSYNVYGNIMSLVYGDNFIRKTDLSSFGDYTFSNLFKESSDNHRLTDISKLILPATTLTKYCYKSMFEYCSKIKGTPQLPATILTEGCYDSMFKNCTSLTTAPEDLSLIEKLEENSCSSMFYKCWALSKLPQRLFTENCILAKNCCKNMFEGCNSLNIAPELPSTTVAENCYSEMFKDCTSLINPPAKLPAKTLNNYCYEYMFSGCTRLKTSPEISAEIVAEGCCRGMFYNCTTLGLAPRLNSEVTAVSCYEGMFEGCTNLKRTPDSTLPAKTLAVSCYKSMFKGCNSFVDKLEISAETVEKQCCYEMFCDCTSLTTAPEELLAKELASLCYYGMFKNCTSLIEPPKLPSNALATYCYSNMFYGCNALTKAPELPAETLVQGCYNRMFYECNNLNYIQMLATSDPSLLGLHNWVAGDGGEGVSGVAPTGIFIKHSDFEDLPINSVHGIPPGWTDIRLASNYFTIEALENNIKISFSKSNLFYRIDKMGDWKELLADNEIKETINSGQKIQFRINKLNNSEELGIGTFTVSGRYNVRGNIMSLLYNSDDIEDKKDLSSFGKNILSSLFKGSTTLVSASNLKLPAMTLNEGCYSEMFMGCESLTEAPELPANNLQSNCYKSMFSGCTSLETSPDLPATKMTGVMSVNNYDCYSYMFEGCTSLVNVPEELPVLSLRKGCYRGMFKNCANLKKAPRLPAGDHELAPECYYEMFMGCKLLVEAPKLPAKMFGDCKYCYRSMFEGCTSLTEAPELPATVVATGSYLYMFKDCTSLKTPPPILPPTKLNEYRQNCYYGMFYGCEKLETAPELPATTLDEAVVDTTLVGGASYCYSKMFYGCTSLIIPPQLPATTLADGCYEEMFYGCTSLIIPPKFELPATILTERCYSNMFSGCTNLIIPPEFELPATKMILFCYKSMFSGCEKLTTAPELRATKLAEGCYEEMFMGCTNLREATQLARAEEIVSNCYKSMFENCVNLIDPPELLNESKYNNKGGYDRMFYGCSKLKYIKMLATTGMNSNQRLSYWVYGVSPVGIFVKHYDVPETSFSRDDHGIPPGWNIQDDPSTIPEPLPTHNGYEYVDLGLPSGLKWAKCNVGAKIESNYGDYFAWGETTPGYSDSDFSWNKYQWCKNGNSNKLTKYCTKKKYGAGIFGSKDDKTVLESSDDAASVKMGGSWRMPTWKEVKELINNTTQRHASINGVYGLLITGKNGNTLFFPASGFKLNNKAENTIGSTAYIVSSSLNKGTPIYYYLFDSKNTTLGDWIENDEMSLRNRGRTIRGVFNG